MPSRKKGVHLLMVELLIPINHFLMTGEPVGSDAVSGLFLVRKQYCVILQTYSGAVQLLVCLLFVAFISLPFLYEEVILVLYIMFVS